MAVAIRLATRKDAPAIAEFAIKLFAQHREYDSHRFAEIASIDGAQKFYASQTEVKNASVLVAEVENKIVGFAYLQYEALDYSNLLENAVWLHDIYVEKGTRGQNAGKLLIEKSVKIAREFGANKLMLSVAARNIYANNFFKRNGFKETMVEMMFDLTEEKDND